MKGETVIIEKTPADLVRIFLPGSREYVIIGVKRTALSAEDREGDKMNYNYHTHTHRCGHASGTEEEYILRAIEWGITHMGFSDHAPFIFPDGYESRFRIPMSEGEDYVRCISDLREKYRDSIDISIGFEMEYYPSHFAEMLAIARRFGAEYLILGQHFIRDEHPDGVYVFRATEDESHLVEYVDTEIICVELAVSRGGEGFASRLGYVEYRNVPFSVCDGIEA